MSVDRGDCLNEGRNISGDDGSHIFKQTQCPLSLWVTVVSGSIPKILIFTFVISCLTEPSLPWFMDLCKVPMQYCSLQHQTLFLPPDTSTIDHHFCFGQTTSFFLELLDYCPPLLPSRILGTFQPGRLIFQCLIFLPFILFLEFSWQEYWSCLPFLPSVNHILSEFFTMICVSWVALQGMAHSFTELHKPFRHNKVVIH